MSEEGEFEIVEDEGEPEEEVDEDVDSGMDEPEPRRQTKADRERSEASAFLLANKEKVRQMGSERADTSGVPDLQEVRGPVPRRQETTTEYLDEFSEVMLAYKRDLRTVGSAVGANRVTPDDPPYPFLPPDFASRLPTLTPAEVRRWATMCDAYTEANNAIEDVAAGGEVVKEGLAMGTRVVEKLSRDHLEMNVDGLATRIRARCAGNKPLMMRLFRRYVEPTLDRMTGGNGAGSSDLLTLGLMFYGEYDRQYEENQAKEKAREALHGQGLAEGGAPLPETRHEQMAAAVDGQLGKKGVRPDWKVGPHTRDVEAELPRQEFEPEPEPEAPAAGVDAPEEMTQLGGAAGAALAQWRKAVGMD